MHRLLRTAPPFLLLAIALFASGCSTLYREKIYSPGRSHYTKPPEKQDAAAALLPPSSEVSPADAALLPPPGEAAPAGAAPGAAAPAPGMDAVPAIPGLPPP